MTLKLNTANRRGRFSKSATVYSNDPQQPETIISLSCVVKQYISILPNNWVKLEGYEGDKIHRKVTITSIEEQPLKITEVTCDSKNKIHYKLKTRGKGKGYTLEVDNRSTEEGSFLGKIKLKTNSKRKPVLVINVYVNLRKEVIVEPDTLSFGIIDTTKEKCDAMGIKKAVTLKDMRGDGLIIEKIKPSCDWIMTEAQKEGTHYTIFITLDENKMSRGHFAEKITIRTNYKRKFLVVNLSGEVL